MQKKQKNNSNGNTRVKHSNQLSDNKTVVIGMGERVLLFIHMTSCTLNSFPSQMVVELVHEVQVTRLTEHDRVKGIIYRYLQPYCGGGLVVNVLD